MTEIILHDILQLCLAYLWLLITGLLTICPANELHLCLAFSIYPVASMGIFITHCPGLHLTLITVFLHLMIMTLYTLHGLVCGHLTITP